MTILEYLQECYTKIIKNLQKQEISLEIQDLPPLQDLILVGKGWNQLRQESILGFELTTLNLKEWRNQAVCRVFSFQKENEYSSNFEMNGKNENFIFYLQELCRFLDTCLQTHIDIEALIIDEELLKLQTYMYIFQSGEDDEIFGGFFSLFAFSGEWLLFCGIEDHHRIFKDKYYTYKTPDYMGDKAFKDFDTLYKDTPRFIQKGEINGVQCDFFWRGGTYYVKFPNGNIKQIIQHFLEIYKQVEEYYYSQDD